MLEFKGYVLGDLSIPYYMAAFFFGFLAILISLYAGSRKRNVLSPETPIAFSWRFLLWDNTKRIFVGLLVMFVTFRFTVPLLSRPLTMEVAFGIGLALSVGMDQFIGWLKKKFDFLQMDREKFKE